MPEHWVVNPQTPKPCPPRFEAIRGAAGERWGTNPVTQEAILAWVREGCPNAAGAMLNAATHRPPIAGQGNADSEEFVAQLIRARVFVQTHP